jgi:hypothetical protein
MIKHWLLNLAVEYPVWLVHLFPVVYAEALNAKPVPHRDKWDCARSLIELFNSGWIKLSSEVPGDDTESRRGIARILDRFLRLAEDDSVLTPRGRLRPTCERIRFPGMQVSYKLTAAGGEAWEEMAEPDWPHILTVSVDTEAGDLFSPDRHLLMAYMGWYQEIEAERIRRDSIAWQMHSDFEIVYWKRLPVVYQASFLLQPAEGGSGPQWSRAPQWFREWYLSAITWHKQP